MKFNLIYSIEFINYYYTVERRAMHIQNERKMKNAQLSCFNYNAIKNVYIMLNQYSVK